MDSDFSSQPPPAAPAPPPRSPVDLDSLPPVVLGPIDVHVDDPADETPLPLPQPYRRRVIPLHHELGSRELMLGWCFWLLGSWFALGMGLTGTPIRWMIFASLVGLLVGWPLFRLSQDGCSRPVTEDDPAPAIPAAPRRSRLTPGLILRDWFALNGVFQAVIWPHVLTGLWHLDQAVCVAFAVAAWSFAVGAIVAWGCGSSSGKARILAMILVLFVLLGEPALLAFVSGIADRAHSHAHWTMHISPIETVYALTDKRVDFDPAPWINPVLLLVLAAIIAWVLLLRRALVRGRDSR